MRASFTRCLAVPILLVTSACATTPPPGAELIGERVRVELASGISEVLLFSRDGTVMANLTGDSYRGTWRIDDGWICFTWPGPRSDCWSYVPLRRGIATPSVSRTGERATITLL